MKKKVKMSRALMVLLELFLILTLIILGVGCPQKGAQERKIVVGLGQEPDNLNPVITTMTHAYEVIVPMYRGLLTFGPDLKWKPDLATEVPTKENGGVSKDEKTVTYRLKRGEQWSDGKPITSADVKYTGLLLSPDPDKPGYSRSGQKITPFSTLGYDKIKSIKTPDDFAVVIEFAEVYAPYLTLFAIGNGFVLPKHILEKEKDLDKSSFNTAPKVSSGPFKFKEWKPGDHITIVKNPNYSDQTVKLNKIIFKIIPDTNTLLAAIKSGEVDVGVDLKEKDIDTLKKVKGIKIRSLPGLSYEHIDFNAQNPILKEVKVRQAIELSVNKKEIIKTLLKGKAEEALSEQPPDSEFANKKLKGSKFNPKKAREFLEEAGWKLGPDGIRQKNGKRLSLTFSTTAGNELRESMQALIQSWLKTIGIEVKIQNYDPAVLFGTLEEGGILLTGKYDITIFTWGYTSPDTDSTSVYSSAYFPPQGLNSLFYKNEELDEHLEEAIETVDVEERAHHYQEASEVLRKEVPTIFLYWRANITSTREEIQGWAPHPLGGMDFWNANELTLE